MPSLPVPASNPFEPPRTADLDGDGVAAGHGMPVSDEATQELIAGLPWIRWSARMTSVSIAVGLIVGAVDLVRAKAPVFRMVTLLSVAVGTAVSTSLLGLLRRLAAASDRLDAGTGGPGPVVAAQASLLKLVGVLAIVVLALAVLSVAAGYAVGRMGWLR